MGTGAATLDLTRAPRPRFARDAAPARAPATRTVDTDRFDRALVRPQPRALDRRPKDPVLATLFTALDHLGRYHRYEVDGLENVPAKGRCIVAFNHSLATYDIGLFAKACYERRGRLTRMLGDHLLFEIPGVKQLALHAGVVDGRPEAARALLEDGELVGVAPGGQKEMLRPSTEAHQIAWDDHRGFARLAIDTQTPIVLAACPGADDIYHVPRWSNDRITQKLYKLFKVPVVIATGALGTPGIGFGAPQLGLGFPVPKPVKLRHVVSQPIAPPPKPDAKPGDPAYEEVLDAFHQKLIREMTRLMAQEPSAPA